MTKIGPEVAQALVNLRGSNDFQTILHWIEESLEKDRDMCQKADGLQLYRAQGSALSLSEFLGAFKEAPTSLQKMKSR